MGGESAFTLLKHCAIQINLLIRAVEIVQGTFSITQTKHLWVEFPAISHFHQLSRIEAEQQKLFVQTSAGVRDNRMTINRIVWCVSVAQTTIMKAIMEA